MSPITVIGGNAKFQLDASEKKILVYIEFFLVTIIINTHYLNEIRKMFLPMTTKPYILSLY